MQKHTFNSRMPVAVRRAACTPSVEPKLSQNSPKSAIRKLRLTHTYIRPQRRTRSGSFSAAFSTRAFSQGVMFSRNLTLLARASQGVLFRQTPTAMSTSPVSAILSQTRGMKVRSAVKKLCSSCASVRRKGKVAPTRVNYGNFVNIYIRSTSFARRTKSTSSDKVKNWIISSERCIARFHHGSFCDRALYARISIEPKT